MHLRQVRYQEDLHEVSEDSVTCEDLIIGSLIKYTDWKYKKEWRVVKIDENGGVKIDEGINVEMPSDCITKIIIRCEVERKKPDDGRSVYYENYKSLFTYAEESGIDMKYYYTSRRKFELISNHVVPPIDRKIIQDSL